MLLWYLLSLSMTAIDQLSKYFVNQKLAMGEMIQIIPGLLSITRVENPGAAFGILSNQTALLAAVSAGVIGGTLVYRKQLVSAPSLIRVGVFVALGGAMGNLIDRIRLRAVTDFIYIKGFSVLNFADIAICTGVGLIALAVLLDGRHQKGGS
jgi:signal peptidase II